METIQKLEVATSLHCQGCVDKVKPSLDTNDKISHWHADINEEVKLTVEGHITEKELDSLLKEKGYHVKSTSGFWSDRYKWNRASFNTLNCLIGCSIGDFGMVFFLQAYYPATPIM